MRQHFKTIILSTSLLISPTWAGAAEPENAPERSDITVMGYNIMMLPGIAGDWDQNQRADHLAPALRTLDSLPDVIGYSEVLDNYSYSTITTIEEFPYATPVGGLVCSDGGWTSISGPCSNAPTVVRGGIMISSQHPIEEQHALVFSSVTSGSPDAQANKGAVYAKIDIGGFKYHIVATHFQATHDGGDDDEHLVRTDQMIEIRDWIDGLNIPKNEPVILTGDFNVPFSKSVQMSDVLAAGNALLNFPNDEGFGSYPYDNQMSKAFVYYYDDDVCYDDTLDYVMHRSDYLQPVATPEVDVIALKSPASFYWSYLDGDWTGCDGSTVSRDGYTTDISDHYPVVATYQYPAGPDVAPEIEVGDVVAIKKSDSRSKLAIVPPDNDFNYFQNAASFPFEFNATEHSWINAFWLADASMLVYSDEAFIRQQTAEAGLTELEFYNQQDTQCFIANNNDFAIFSCRGTEPTTFADYLTDIDYDQVAAEKGGLVHEGFKTALDVVWTPVSARLTELKSQGKALWFAGHSMGGAMTQLAADRFCSSAIDCDVSGLYTVGQPAVGNEDFGNDFHAPYYRSVYYQDPIPRLLGSPLGFKHTPSEVVYFDYYGHYTGQQTYPTTPTPNMVYHAPFYYAVYNWNNYVESLKPTDGANSSSTTVDTRAEGIIIDNNSVDYAETGNWETATSGAHEGDDYRLSIDSAAKASWSFNVSQAGSYEIFFKAPGAFGYFDTYYGSDATTFTLYQGETELASIAADLYNNSYDFTSIAEVELNTNETYSIVITGAYTGSSDYAISADAIKVVYTGPEVEDPVEVPVEAVGCGDDPLCIDPTLAEVVLDNDNATYYSETGGGWKDKSNSSANNGGYRYGTELASEAHWTFKVAETGSYQVLFKSPGGFGWGHGYGSDKTVYSVKAGNTELAATNPGSIDLYYNSYEFGDVEVANVTLTAGESYTVTVSGVYHTRYTYGITADAIKLVHVAN
jgi:phospholipase C